jgi:hypothetical protein
LPKIDARPIKPVFMRASGVLNGKFKTPDFHRCSPLLEAAKKKKANQRPCLKKGMVSFS